MRRLRSLILTLALILPAPAFAEIVASDIAVVRDEDGKITEAAATPNGYLAAIAKKFYLTHQDRYDAIFVFTSIPLSFLTNVQQGWPVRSNTKGIGRDFFYNQGPQFGSKGRLRQAVKMGDISQLHDDPDKLYTGIPLYGLTGIELMGHEFGHQWLVSIGFDKGDGQGKHCMARGWESPGEGQVGDQMCDGASINGFNQHWSYYTDSRSVMYGSTVEDIGGGQFKVRLTEEFKFSPLDQYLMGLRGPQDVPPMMLVDIGYRDGSGALPSTIAKEATVSGTRVDVHIEDVIRAEGERDPPYEPCHWKGAIIVLDSQQYPATPKILAKMVRWANRWEEYYAYATDGRGSFDVTIDSRGLGTVGCPYGSGPVDPGPETMPDVAEGIEEVLAPSDVIEARDDAPSPPDWAGIDFGSDEGEAQDTASTTDRTPSEDAEATDRGVVEVPGGTCVPGVLRCEGEAVYQCAVDGKWTWRHDCAASNLVCLDGGTCGKRPKGGGCAAGSTTVPLGVWLLLALPFLALLPGRRKAG